MNSYQLNALLISESLFINGTSQIWKMKGSFNNKKMTYFLLSLGNFTSSNDAGYVTTPENTTFSWSCNGCLWVYRCFISCKLIRRMGLPLIPSYSVYTSMWHNIFTYSIINPTSKQSFVTYYFAWNWFSFPL